MNLQIFLKSVVFKICIFVIIFTSVIGIKPNNNTTDNKAKYNAIGILDSALTKWDAWNYKTIAKNGYVDNSQKFPKNISHAAFYPGLSIIFYISNFICFILFCFNFWYFVRKYWLGIKITNESGEPIYDDKTGESKSQYLLFGFLVFPFSAFLHFNYTELYFLLGGIIAFNLILENKIWKSQIPALIIGFFRPTALFFGLFAWILFSIQSFKDRSNFIIKDYIFKSFGFASYGVGTICLFAFNHVMYGNWMLFFDSQKHFFGKKNDPAFIFNTLKDLMGQNSFWYDNPSKYKESIAQLGFNFYTKDFNLVFLLWLPFLVAIVGFIALIKQKKYFWLAYSWGLLIPTLLSNTVSFNRYLIVSFPLILAFYELFYPFKILRYLILGISTILFILTTVLFTHSFWVG
jgi:hypothetical protein